MKYITVNDLINTLMEIDEEHKNLPVLLCIDPDQSYSKRILQPLSDVKMLKMTNAQTGAQQDAIGLFNIEILD